MITVMLVDYDPTDIKVLRKRLSADEDIQIVGEAQDSHRALQLVQELRPDVVLVDKEMPRIDGVRVAQAMESFAPGTSVLLTVRHIDPDIGTPTRSSKVVKSVVLAVDEDDKNDVALLEAIQSAAGNAIINQGSIDYLIP
jgi:DNA-binding NarL/FixJ family response regulator